MLNAWCFPVELIKPCAKWSVISARQRGPIAQPYRRLSVCEQLFANALSNQTPPIARHSNSRWLRKHTDREVKQFVCQHTSAPGTPLTGTAVGRVWLSILLFSSVRLCVCVCFCRSWICKAMRRPTQGGRGYIRKKNSKYSHHRIDKW